MIASFHIGKPWVSSQVTVHSCLLLMCTQEAGFGGGRDNRMPSAWKQVQVGSGGQEPRFPEWPGAVDRQMRLHGEPGCTRYDDDSASAPPYLALATHLTISFL